MKFGRIYNIEDKVQITGNYLYTCNKQVKLWHTHNSYHTDNTVQVHCTDNSLFHSKHINYQHIQVKSLANQCQQTWIFLFGNGGSIQQPVRHGFMLVCNAPEVLPSINIPGAHKNPQALDFCVVQVVLNHGLENGRRS